MKDVGGLFADLTGMLEDLHGLAVEGQAPSQPPEVLHALTIALTTGLQTVSSTLRRIRQGLADV